MAFLSKETRRKQSALDMLWPRAARTALRPRGTGRPGQWVPRPGRQPRGSFVFSFGARTWMGLIVHRSFNMVCLLSYVSMLYDLFAGPWFCGDTNGRSSSISSKGFFRGAQSNKQSPIGSLEPSTPARWVDLGRVWGGEPEAKYAPPYSKASIVPNICS